MLTNRFADIVWIVMKILIPRVLSLTNDSQELCPITILIFEFPMQYFGSIATSNVVLESTIVSFDWEGWLWQNSFAGDSLAIHCCLLKAFDMQLKVVSSTHSYRLQVANTAFCQTNWSRGSAAWFCSLLNKAFVSFNSLSWPISNDWQFFFWILSYI